MSVLPKEELDFFIEVGKNQSNLATFSKIFEKLQGIDIKEFKKIFDELEDEIKKQLSKEDIEELKHIEDPESYEKFIEKICNKIPITKYASKFRRIKIHNVELLIESTKKILDEAINKIEKDEKRIIQSYGTYPGDLTFLWFYFSTNAINKMREMLDSLNKSHILREKPKEKQIKSFNNVLFYIGYGFARLTAISLKLKDDTLVEDDIIELQEELFEISIKYLYSIEYIPEEKKLLACSLIA